MGSVSSASNFVAKLQQLSSAVPTTSASDGDTAAQEAAESSTTKQAEKSNAGHAPHSAGLVNKTA